MRELMKSLLAMYILLLVCGCVGKSTDPAIIAMNDSISKAKEDSARIADSLAIIEIRKADSIAKVKEAEKQAYLKNAKKNFRFKKDEFSSKTWVYHNATPKYTNVNSVHLYFEQDNRGKVSNLRFRVQYEDDNWLFIKNVIFNIDGENHKFYPEYMKRDCGNGGRIWEWSDEPAFYNKRLIEKISKAKTVKMKFNGDQYYNIKTMNAKQINAFKETLNFYKALGGSLNY